MSRVGSSEARMAKLADAADLKSAGRKAVGVQVPLWAPTLNLKSLHNVLVPAIAQRSNTRRFRPLRKPG